MKVSIKDVEYVAKLSRLVLDEQEKEGFTHDLNGILEYADQLSRLNTKDVEPTAHVLPMKNVLREDESRPSMERDDILMNAPDQQDGCFKVPKVVE